MQMSKGNTEIQRDADVSGNQSQPLNEEWLHDFYKECGRETTLAYTTLNQMKNWAMIVAAAALSGMSFGSKSSDFPTPIMFAGAVIVYTFILRFFVRAMICYVNLIRWNVLQARCVELKLVSDPIRPGAVAESRERQFRDALQHYYFEWLSPLSRKDQVFQNLKLGFYLLFGLSLFFMIWGATVLWQHYFVRGLVTFAVLNTLLEAHDFFNSKYFDDVAADKRRKARGQARHVFPVPRSRGAFLAGWILNLLASTAVAVWPVIRSVASQFWRTWHG
jgi:hypothetical protein